MIDVLGEIFRSLGRRNDAASGSGSVNAKLAQLLARLESAAWFEGSTQVPIIRPDLATGTAVTGAAGVWTYGLWAEVVAAGVLSSHALVAMIARSGVLNQEFQLQIGTGGAGSEVVIGSFYFLGAQTSTTGYPPAFNLPVPLQIPVNARVAARVANGGGASAAIALQLQFLPRPF